MKQIFKKKFCFKKKNKNTKIIIAIGRCTQIFTFILWFYVQYCKYFLQWLDNIFQVQYKLQASSKLSFTSRLKSHNCLFFKHACHHLCEYLCSLIFLKSQQISRLFLLRQISYLKLGTELEVLGQDNLWLETAWILTQALCLAKLTYPQLMLEILHN